MKSYDMIKDWLKTHGYDGLVYVDLECGCHVDDLIPCGEVGEDCEAAMHRPDLRPPEYATEHPSYWMVTKQFSDANPKEGKSSLTEEAMEEVSECPIQVRRNYDGV